MYSAIASSWNLILKMKVEMPSLKFNFINGLVKRWCLNFKIQLLHPVRKKPISTTQKLRNELGPQQPSKYIEQETFGPVYQLWPISTKLFYFNPKSNHSIKEILMSIRRHFNSLRNEGQIVKIECKTNRISQKWENLLKSRKKLFQEKLEINLLYWF